MQSSQPTPFEVYCDRCRVTFPLGTRRCIHCGGPTSAARGRPGLRLEPTDEAAAAEAEPPPELGPRRVFSPVTLVWVALIAAGYLYRSCAGQAP